jgi:mono/diheme cytochrome c family protein
MAAWRSMTMAPGVKRSGLAVLLLAAGLLVPQTAPAADGNPGRSAYFQYCSSCHGDDGRGNGEVAASLHPKPADLTQLAKKNGGAFPYAEVKQIIDGRKRVAAHGSAKMPVWGAVFAEEKTYERPEAHAQSQIELITAYLASIQTN